MYILEASMICRPCSSWADLSAFSFALRECRLKYRTPPPTKQINRIRMTKNLGFTLYLFLPLMTCISFPSFYLTLRVTPKSEAILRQARTSSSGITLTTDMATLGTYFCTSFVKSNMASKALSPNSGWDVYKRQRWYRSDAGCRHQYIYCDFWNLSPIWQIPLYLSLIHI